MFLITRKRSTALAIAISVVTFMAPKFVKAGASAEDLVRKADHRRGLQGSFTMIVKTIVDERGEKTEQEYRVNVRDGETSLVEQVQPARAAGRKLLMKGFDMWLFTPQVKKPVRIGLQQRLTGDIANGDISRTNYAQDYVASIINREADGTVVIELKAKDKRVTYSRIKYWIEESTAKPVKAEFFALNGKLMKTATFSDFKKIEGTERMSKVVISDAVTKNRTSTLIYSKQKTMKFSDSEFNKEQMDR